LWRVSITKRVDLAGGEKKKKKDTQESFCAFVKGSSHLESRADLLRESMAAAWKKETSQRKMSKEGEGKNVRGNLGKSRTKARKINFSERFEELPTRSKKGQKKNLGREKRMAVKGGAAPSW